MSFFLKKTVIKGRTYLQISQSFYDPKKKTSSNRVYEKIGYLDKLIEQGIDDPIAIYTRKIEKLNKAHREIIEKEKREKISENNSKNFGYFLIKSDIQSQFTACSGNKPVCLKPVGDTLNVRSL